MKARLALKLGLLAAVYLAVLGSARPADAGIAVLVAIASLAATRELSRPAANGEPAGSLVRRVLAFPRFAAGAAVEVVRGTAAVARVVLAPRPRPYPGLVDVPIGERTPTGVAVSALVMTLAPGSVLVDVDRDAGVMVYQVLDARDPAGIAAAHTRFYERFQRAVFP